ncbi:MAG: NAD(P)H-dependent oxidoreductase subunit E [Woeseiaceae bacterium]|nr:NAD(P)H-dependent oxidoreductase subunit E [Woeseiaceae bacterium]
MDYDRERASAIIADFGARPEQLVQILHRFMDAFGTISEAAVRQLADELNLSRAEVHGVVSYYHDFRTDPPSRHVIRICEAESCQAMGSRELARHAEEALGLPMHSANGELRLEPVYCLGNCACSPAVMIDGRTYGRVTPARFDELVADSLEAPA